MQTRFASLGFWRAATVASLAWVAFYIPLYAYFALQGRWSLEATTMNIVPVFLWAFSIVLSWLGSRASGQRSSLERYPCPLWP